MRGEWWNAPMKRSARRALGHKILDWTTCPPCWCHSRPSGARATEPNRSVRGCLRQDVKRFFLEEADDQRGLERDGVPLATPAWLAPDLRSAGNESIRSRARRVGSCFKKVGLSTARGLVLGLAWRALLALAVPGRHRRQLVFAGVWLQRRACPGCSRVVAAVEAAPLRIRLIGSTTS